MAVRLTDIWRTIISILRLNLLWFFVYGEDDSEMSQPKLNQTTGTGTQASSLDTEAKSDPARDPQPITMDDPSLSWIYCLSKPQLKSLLVKHNLPSQGNTNQLQIAVANATIEGLIEAPISLSEARNPNFDLPTLPKPRGRDTLTERETGNIKEILGLPPDATYSEIQRTLVTMTHTRPEPRGSEEHLMNRTMLPQPSQAYERMERPRVQRMTTNPSGINESGIDDLPTRTTNVRTMDTATLCNTVRKWNLRFDGRRKDDAMLFLERLHELMDAYEVPQEGVIKALPELLKDSALLWYRNNRHLWGNFTQFLKDFHLQYLPNNFQNQLDDEIKTRVQEENEPFRQFVVSLTTLMRRRGGLNEQEKLERVYTNMHPSYKMYVRRRDFTNLATLSTVAEEYESCLREQLNTRPPHRSTQPGLSKTTPHGKSYHSQRLGLNTSLVAGTDSPGTIRNKTNQGPEESYYRQRYNSPKDTPQFSGKRPTPKETPRENTEVCWNCEATGHLYRNCPQPKALRCYNCKKPNTRTTSCSCRRLGNDQGTSNTGGHRSPIPRRN